MTEPAATTKTSPAEDLAELVTELIDEVATDEPVTRYKYIRRGGGRTVKVVDPNARHITRDVGLLDQLHAIKSAKASVPVRVYQWESAHHGDDGQGDDGQGDDDRCGAARNGERCAHGQWVHVRTEQRPAARLGVVTAGAAVPGGGSGWDNDGALNPLRSLGFESASPATSAPELYNSIHRGADRLRRDLRAAAGRTWGGRKTPSEALRECVGLLLDVDDDTARSAVHQARGWASTCRIFLGYDAPIVKLRDLVCGQCGGQLHVRADASTAVWCAGFPETQVIGPGWPGDEWGPVEYPPEPGCGERYPRGSWIKLLEQAVKAG